MPGDYLFPKRTLRPSGDILDPDEFNQSSLPAAGRLSEGLNQHNIRAPLSEVDAPIEAGAFARAQFLSKFVPSGVSATTPPFGGPATGDWKDRVDLYSTLSWQRVSNPDATGDADTVVQVTAGKAMLSLRASLWYSYHPDEDASAAAPSDTLWAEEGATSFTGMSMPSLDNTTDLNKTNYRANVQFAIRINGVVLQETITGRVDIEQRPFYPYRVNDPRAATDVLNAGSTIVGSAAVNMAGPESYRLKNRVEGLGVTVYPVRIGYHILTEPGEFQVELVARRCSIGKRQVSGDFVSVYSRQLSVLVLPIEPVHDVGSYAAVAVDPVRAEDPVNTNQLQTQRLEKIRDATNDLSPGQFARGALNRDHLRGRSLVIDSGVGIAGVSAAQSGLQTTSLNSASSISYDDSSHQYQTTATSYAWTPGLRVVEAPTTVKDLNRITISPDTLNTPQFLCVYANVDLKDVHIQGGSGIIGPGAAEPTGACALAYFALAFRFSHASTWWIWRPSEVFINSANYTSYDEAVVGSTKGGQRVYAIHADIPLMANFDLSTVRPGAELERIKIVSMLVNVAKSATMTTTAEVTKSSLQAIALRSGG